MSRTKPLAPLHGPVFRDATGESFGDRLRYLKARTGMQSKHGALSNREIAGKVSGKLAANASYTPAAISGWMRDKWVPDTRIIAIVAELFHCDPGWLAFGAASRALSPEQAQREGQERDTIARVADLLRHEAQRPVDYGERPVVRAGRRPREA